MNIVGAILTAWIVSVLLICRIIWFVGHKPTPTPDGVPLAAA